MVALVVDQTVTTNSDAELIRRSREGDQQAYGQLVERYQSLVCSVAYSRCGDLGLSEDLAQEAFVRGWQKLSTLRDPNSFRSWIATIVRNLATRRHENDASSVSNTASSLESVGDVATKQKSPEDSAVSAEEEAIVWNALSTIPEQFREPMVLFYREEQSVKRVAAALELTEDTVKQRLARGRKALRKTLESSIASTLVRSRPAQGFASAVLLAIGGIKTKSATAAAVGTGAAIAGKTAAKAGLWASIGSFVAFLPVIGSLYLAVAAMYQAVLDNCESQEEVSLTHRNAVRMLIEMVVALLLCVATDRYFHSIGYVGHWRLLNIAPILAMQLRIRSLSRRHDRQVTELRARLSQSAKHDPPA